MLEYFFKSHLSTLIYINIIIRLFWQSNIKHSCSDVDFKQKKKKNMMTLYSTWNILDKSGGILWQREHQMSLHKESHCNLNN